MAFRTNKTVDYIIVGGGLAGCVLASRLHQGNPSKDILLLEARPDKHENPNIKMPLAAFTIHNTDLEYNYKTTPQKHLNNRQVYNCGGKVLSGGSAVNYALWTRGDAAGKSFIASRLLLCFKGSHSTLQRFPIPPGHPI